MPKFVDEQGLVRGDHLSYLLQVDAAGAAFQQYTLDLCAECRNVRYDFDSIGDGEIFCTVIDTGSA
jgi:hypothetical protein